MVNRRPQGYLDNDCEANIDENMCKLIDAINEGGGGGGDVVVPPAVSKVAVTTPSNTDLAVTLTFDDKSTKVGKIPYANFSAYLGNAMSNFFTSEKYAYIEDSYFETIPRYTKALDYIAPTTEGLTTLMKVCENNKPPETLDNMYVGTTYELALGLNLLGVPTTENGVKTYPVIELNDSQIVNYTRFETNGDSRGVGVYRNEYYKFKNVSCSTANKTKPLVLILTLDQFDRQDFDNTHLDAPCIIKLADKVSDFDFENTIIKIQNGGRTGDFVVSLIEAKTNGVIRISNSDHVEKYVTSGIVNCYGGSIVEYNERLKEPKVIFALKNLEDSMANANTTSQRLFVKSIALATDLCYTADTVPDMSAYSSGITGFKIDMWIDQFEFKDADMGDVAYPTFAQNKYRKQYKKGY